MLVKVKTSPPSTPRNETTQRSRRSSTHEVNNAFDGTVNRSIRMRSACPGAYATGGLQRHGHRTDHVVARPVTCIAPQDDSRAADMLRVLGEGREHPILGIGSSLRVAGFVFADDLDPHGFHSSSGWSRSTLAMFFNMKDMCFLRLKQSTGHIGRRSVPARSVEWLMTAGQECLKQKRAASE